MLKIWNKRSAANLAILLATLSLLTQGAGAFEKGWYHGGMARSEALTGGFTTGNVKMVPMLTCQDAECAGKKVPEIMKFGDSYEQDSFGSLDIPRVFINQKWFVERKIALLKYYDQSDELNKYANCSLDLGEVNSTKRNCTLDNRFDFITVE